MDELNFQPYASITTERTPSQVIPRGRALPYGPQAISGDNLINQDFAKL